MNFILERCDSPQQGKKIGDMHGKVLEVAMPCGEKPSGGEVKVVPLYHPAATFYNQDLKDVMEEDFQVLKQFV